MPAVDPRPAAAPADPDLVAPKVTPYLLRRADDLCARRLDHDFRGVVGSQDPVNRARVRAAFLDAARTAHTLDVRIAAPWTAPTHLEPEEVAVFEQAVHWYCRRFGDRAVHLADHDLDRPSEVDGVDVRLGGWVDLTVIGTDGRREVRLLDFWARAAPATLLDEWVVRLALLRLEEWLGTDPVLVSWTDLLHGVRVEEEVDPGSALAAARAALDERVGTVRARTAEPAAQHGADCPSCAHHTGCAEFPRAFKVRIPRDALLPGILPITPSALEAWHRCRRLWRNQHVLSVPASDDAPSGVHGQQVHDLLRVLHRDGPCTDPSRIDDLVAAHGASPRVDAELRDHARRCPPGATALGHEITRARLHARRPGFVAAARIDAAWIHDGVLDVRDYKTGMAWHDRVVEDPRARLQAWVMAPVAEAHGLRLRVRYEHLAAEVVDDPEPWEPDPDELEAVTAELVTLVQEMRAEREWRGVADPAVCGACRYRSICPDSASKAEPAWPRLEDDPDAPAGAALGDDR